MTPAPFITDRAGRILATTNLPPATAAALYGDVYLAADGTAWVAATAVVDPAHRG